VNPWQLVPITYAPKYYTSEFTSDPTPYNVNR